MKRLQIFIQCFLTVTTGIVIIAAFTYRNIPETITPDTLWQILLSAGLCALATTLFFPDENAGKVRIWIGIALHFLSLCVIMVCCGRWFGWVETLWEALLMVGYVVIVYAFTTGINLFLAKKQAASLNRGLKEKYPDTTSES